MKNTLSPFFNPVQLIKAFIYHKRSPKYNKAENDLELKLYSEILDNDMLHYGYFDDIERLPEYISIGQLENAQRRYAEIIVEQINDKNSPVLDVGCGMGGLSNYLLKNGFNVESLTPDINQRQYIQRVYNDLHCYYCKFEELKTEKKFGTIINSESLQYISIDEAFKKVENIILPHGRWIITDCFRTNEESCNGSGHVLIRFLGKIKEHGWTICYQRDITMHILPMLKLIYMYVDRFLIPLSHYAEEKLKYKKAWLYYLTGNLRKAISEKSRKEICAINPEVFLAEKKYMIFVLQKKQ